MGIEKTHTRSNGKVRGRRRAMDRRGQERRRQCQQLALDGEERDGNRREQINRDASWVFRGSRGRWLPTDEGPEVFGLCQPHESQGQTQLPVLVRATMRLAA